MEVFVPDSNRMVAAFMPAAELKSYQEGNKVGLARYALVEVSRKSESSEFSATDFQDVADSIDKQYASSADSAAMDAQIKEAEAEINSKMKAADPNVASTTLDKPVILGRFFSKPDVYCFGMVLPVTSNDATASKMAAMMLMRVKNHMLFVYLYSEYKGDETVQWVRSTEERWAQAIFDANKR